MTTKERIEKEYKELKDIRNSYLEIEKKVEEFVLKERDDDIGFVFPPLKTTLDKDKKGGFKFFLPDEEAEDNTEFSYVIHPDLRSYYLWKNFDPYGQQERRVAIGFRGEQKFVEWDFIGHLPHEFDPPYGGFFGQGNYERKIYWEYKAKNGIMQVKLQKIEIEYDIFFNKDDGKFYSGIPVETKEIGLTHTYAGRVYYEYSADTEEEEYRFEPASFVKHEKLKIPDNFDIFQKAKEGAREAKEKAKYKEAIPERSYSDNFSTLEYMVIKFLDEVDSKLVVLNELIERLEKTNENENVKINENVKTNENENVKININNNINTNKTTSLGLNKNARTNGNVKTTKNPTEDNSVNINVNEDEVINIKIKIGKEKRSNTLDIH